MLTPVQVASSTYRIALGSHAGHKLLSLQTVPSGVADPQQPGCVIAHGFEWTRRRALWRTSAQGARKPEPLFHPPGHCHERLNRNRAGELVLQLKSPYRDGTTHIVMSPLQFMQRLTRRIAARPLPASTQTSTEWAARSIVECREQLKLVGLAFVMIDEERRLIRCDQLPDFFH